MPFLIAITIILGSHISVDTDFPKETREAVSVIFIIIAVVYLIFGLII